MLLRALVGGTIVSLFALLGDVLKPKSFAGLFGAAPSVALATLWLTIRSHGASYAAVEAGSMMVGALAFGAYAYIVCRVFTRSHVSMLPAVSIPLVIWFTIAFVLRAVVL